MLQTILLLWLTACMLAFVFRIYKHLTATGQQSTPSQPENESDDDSIIGKTVSPVKEDDELPLPEGAKLVESLPEDTEQNTRVENYCAETTPTEDDLEESVDSCELDKVENHFEAVTSTQVEFEQKINDPEKMLELTTTNIKLKDSVYYTQLKENNEVSKKIDRLVEIAEEIGNEAYARNLQKTLNEES